MTYNEDDGVVVPELRLRVEGDGGGIKGEYVKLRGNSEVEEEGEGVLGLNGGGGRGGEEEGFSGLLCWKLRWYMVWYWIKLAVIFACLGSLAFVFLKWVAPYFMDKELMPIINWELATFSRPVLAIILYASLAFFPAVLLPSSPSMWVAGMTFGYGYGFLLIISAAAVGVSLPYFISYLFLHRIQGLLDRYPKKAAILRVAGAGNWFHQFRAVTLIRISPFPYMIYNYCALATHVRFGPYFLGSLVGIVPEIFIAIYTGILIQTLANASDDHNLSAQQIIFNLLGFCATVATGIIFTVFAKRRLKVLQEDPLLA